MTDTALQQKRLVAAAIDVGIGFAGGIVLTVVLTILGLIVRSAGGSSVGHYMDRITGFVVAVGMLGYVLGRDVLAGGRSFGKKTQDLKVVDLKGRPVGPVESAKRNAIFAAGVALAALSATLQLFPCVGDVVACVIFPFLFLGLIGSLGAAAYEIFRITQDPAGIRYGDQLAGTRVMRG